MEMHQVPNGFRQKVIDVHGDAGNDWLSRLAQTIGECERRWSLQVMPPFGSLSYNYVTFDPQEYVDALFGVDAQSASG